MCISICLFLAAWPALMLACYCSRNDDMRAGLVCCSFTHCTGRVWATIYKLVPLDSHPVCVPLESVLVTGQRTQYGVMLLLRH
jgi:hypothetical protein